ncbi:hypothetical protein MJO28_008282 [Puccinia striiformis f. sp. tritici]|uniref:Uncharacterized protein n=1 Tax=Puccinia striiformis f. sp. tritici TaxID=168172 RepID=A0ACC0EC86_9BASI|nr:hypothetical protein Pst134EA_015643 [Puccinia striiformis f. sp. tritici]KAH9463553.1 hypothetical protein Pst134EA_015643 [Puccinia striiformis f. sp. tritici]KAI7949461.1 hypothetical protein MJO28_008282 [Puccinia striiformis f. sp. tritici]KAI7952565.1 hypothetical protein MJO29_008196 [Puccinia striiformis f. sp. tritici]KAI9602636.1 hypothetical protein H4Q26_001927 [Puccinia striiformis f. sp. tritici PST-130]
MLTSGGLTPDHFLTPQQVFLGSNSPGSSSPFQLNSNVSSDFPTVGQCFNSGNSNDTTTLASADFDVDVRSGFLSPAPPLSRISDPVYQPWEDALEVVSKLISQITNEESKLGEVVKWKEFIVSELPVLSIDPLRSEIVEMRRARLVLAFLTHAFVHSLASSQNSSQETQVTIPLSLAVPFSEISLALDMPPVLTYADTVLYNWLLKEPALGFTVENIEIPTTFTLSDSEKHFYKTSVLVEALGPVCLKLMRSSLDEAFMEDEISVKRIGNNLGRLAKQIDHISKVLSDVRAGCDPRTFYWEIRPWFIGGRWKWEGIESDASNKCNIKEDTRQTSEERQWKVTELGGPSAGQSTLIHAIDVFLGVDHEPNLQEVSSGIQDEDTFMNRMSTYMPHHHRLFLQQLSRSCLTRRGHPNLIRSVVVNHQDQEFKSGPNNLKENYNLCIKALENLRKTHTKIVSLFIICQKNSSPPSHPLALNSSNIITSPSNPCVGKTCRAVPLDGKLKDVTNHTEAKGGQSKPTALLEIRPKDYHAETKTRIEQSEVVEESQDVVLKGTGGTDLSKFLRRCKLRTTQAFIE